MSLQIGQAYQVFHGLNGMPLDNGKIYVGVAGKNPITDPIKIYYDESFTKTAANPATTINGYVSRNGTPTNIYVNVDKCSLFVYEKNGRLVFSDLNFNGFNYLLSLDASNVFDKNGFSQQQLNNIFSSKGYLDVRLYGVNTSSSSNQGTLINSIDAIARSLNKGLYFPTGTYLASGLLPTVSWIGDGVDKTLIKNYNSVVFDGFIKFKNNVDFKLFQDISFSGGVNADPSTDNWNGIYDTWFKGSCAFVAESSKNLIFNRCDFKESKMSALRIYSGCNNIYMFDCTVSHARGNFGDGIYIQNSSNVFSDNLNISDVTRIGVVFEGNTKNCLLKTTSVTNAHHASINYGGTEYNAGFWSENSANIRLKDCNTLSTGEYGYLMTTGNLLTGIDVAKFTLENCTADGNNIGFLIRSKQDSVTVRQLMINCVGLNSKSRPFYVQARYETDEFTLNDCYGEVHGDLSTLSTDIISGLMVSSEFTYAGKLPKLNIKNMTFKHINVDISKYKDETVYTSDITFFGAANFEYTFDNIRNIDSTIPVYIKNRLAAANVNDISVFKNGNYFFPRLRTVLKTNIENCNILGGNVLSTGKVRINNSPVTALFAVTSDDLRVNNCDMNFANAVDFFSYTTATSTNKITAKFNNCNFNKDITTNDYALKLQMDGTNKAKVLINGCEFYNISDVVTSTNTHVWIVRSPTSVIYQNVLRDSTANLQKVNTSVSTSEPAGSTSIVMH